jgi:glutamate racemase
MQKPFANPEPKGEALVREIEDEVHLSSKRIRIGIFDSGLGGLTIVQAISQVIKGAELFYIADTLHAPYGEKSHTQILQYSLDITQYLIATHKIDALVVACNTATSAAITQLRATYPNLIIIGTEPAVKPALDQTHTGKVGVLATPATLRGDKYQTLVDRVNHQSVTLYEQACAGLVEHIENDTLETPESLALLKSWLLPMRDEGVDTIVLGCTHYPLASKVIKRIMDNEVVLIDSGLAISNYLLECLKEVGHMNNGILKIHFYHTGNINGTIVKKLLGINQKMTYIKIT